MHAAEKMVAHRPANLHFRLDEIQGTPVENRFHDIRADVLYDSALFVVAFVFEDFINGADRALHTGGENGFLVPQRGQKQLAIVQVDKSLVVASQCVIRLQQFLNDSRVIHG